MTKRRPSPDQCPQTPSQGFSDVQDGADVRGVGGESCSVRAYRFEFFYSGFTPGSLPSALLPFQIALNLIPITV